MTIILSEIDITKIRYDKGWIYDVVDSLLSDFEWLESYNMPEYMVSLNVGNSVGRAPTSSEK